MIIAIEGIDGVGKGTQSAILRDKLRSAGHTATLISFPVYTSFYGKMIGEYLNGNYGSLEGIHPKLIANLYALDRWKFFESNPYVPSDDFVVIDRYVPSNYAHQASKFHDHDQVAEMILWINELEYEVLKQPQPDLVLVLDAPVSLASSQVMKKAERAYTSLKKDLHEDNKEYLEEVRRIFANLCKNDENYIKIQCNEGERMRGIEDIASQIWTIISARFLSYSA